MTELTLAERFVYFVGFGGGLIVLAALVALVGYLLLGGDAVEPSATADHPWLDEADEEEPEIVEGEFVEEATDIVVLGNIWGRS